MPCLDPMFCFSIPSKVLYKESKKSKKSNKSTSRIPIVERDAKALSAAASALTQIKELMSLPYEVRTLRLNELEVERLEESLTSAERRASRAATMAGTSLYHRLLDAPEIMRNVLSHFENRDLVCFSLTSKECARLAEYLAPAPERWTFVDQERCDLFMYLKEDEGWFGDLEWCNECENMMPHSQDLGDLCDECAEEYDADIRAHQDESSSEEEDEDESSSEEEDEEDEGEEKDEDDEEEDKEKDEE